MATKPDLAVVSWGRGEQGPSRGNRSEAILERLVSRRIRGMSVVCLPVEAASDPPSSNWLGRHSPRERVRSAGLWNDADVDAEFDSTFLEVFGGLVLDTRSLASRRTTQWPIWPGASQRAMSPRRGRHGTRR